MSQPSSATADRAVNLAYVALAPLAILVAGFWVWPDAGPGLLAAFKTWAAILLGFYAGLHWGYALWHGSDSPPADQLMLRYLLPLAMVGIAALLPGMWAVLLSLAGFGWAYLAGREIQAIAPDWLQRLRQRVAWTAAVCHLAALAWLARGDFLAS